MSLRVLSLLGLLAIGAIAGCDSEPTGGACLDGYAAESLAAQDLEALNDALDTCFSDDAAELEGQAGDLPKTMGSDARNDREVEVFYFCSDVCPDAGGVGIRYRGVEDATTCCEIGGVSYSDFAWGGFVGCAPPEADAFGEEIGCPL